MPTISPENTSLIHESKQIITNLGAIFDAEINHPYNFLTSLISQETESKHCNENGQSKKCILLNVPNVNIRLNGQLKVISGKPSEGLYLYDKDELLHHFKRAVLKKHMLDISYEPRRFETSFFFDTALKEIEGNILTSFAFRSLNIRFQSFTEVGHQGQITCVLSSPTLTQLSTGSIENCNVGCYPEDLTDPLFQFLNLVLNLRRLRNALIDHEREYVYRPHIIKSMYLLMTLSPFGILYSDNDLAKASIFILAMACSIWCWYMVRSYNHHYSIPQTASNSFKGFFDTIHNPKDIEQREVTPDSDHSDHSDHNELGLDFAEYTNG
ncbi:MAG: hypothetical protein CMF42_02000 [Legionellales bacterium]|nr:hypothetical protein [Legionellales bacterium]